MPMDALRMNQIREALDADKVVQGQAFDIVKRWVSTQQEEPVEYQQLNEEDINTAGELVSAFQELLEKKLAEVSHRIRNNSQEAPANDSEIALVEDVINAYNRLISVVINPGNTQQTKEALLTAVLKSEATIKRLEILLDHVLDRMAATNNVAILKPGFGLFLKAYNVYNLMSRQLTTHSLVVITPGDLSTNLRAVASGKPRWARIMQTYGINPPDYESIEPQGPGGPPGGPGGPGPGSGPGPGPGPGRGPGAPPPDDGDGGGDEGQQPPESGILPLPTISPSPATARPPFEEVVRPSSSGPSSQPSAPPSLGGPGAVPLGYRGNYTAPQRYEIGDVPGDLPPVSLPVPPPPLAEPGQGQRRGLPEPGGDPFARSLVPVEAQMPQRPFDPPITRPELLKIGHAAVVGASEITTWIRKKCPTSATERNTTNGCKWNHDYHTCHSSHNSDKS